MDNHKYFNLITLQFNVHPICAVIGSCHADRMILVNEYAEREFPGDFYRFELNNFLDGTYLENFELAMALLESIDQQLIIINDIQLKPELFSLLRVLVDRARTVLNRPTKKIQRFLILGSISSDDFLHRSAQRLTGRIGYVEMSDYERLLHV